jgi:hypothetical protein
VQIAADAADRIEGSFLVGDELSGHRGHRGGVMLGSTIAMPRCSAGARRGESAAQVQRSCYPRSAFFSSGNDSGSSSEESLR